MLFNMKQLLEFAKQTMERYPAIKSNIEELIELTPSLRPSKLSCR
jgi:hypothetical protein